VADQTLTETADGGRFRVRAGDVVKPDPSSQTVTITLDVVE